MNLLNAAKKVNFKKKIQEIEKKLEGSRTLASTDKNKNILAILVFCEDLLNAMSLQLIRYYLFKLSSMFIVSM